MNAESQEAIAYFTEHYENARKQYPSLPDLAQFDKSTDVLEVLSRQKHTPRNVIAYTRWYFIQFLSSVASTPLELIVPPQNPYLYTELEHVSEQRRADAALYIEWMGDLLRESHLVSHAEDDALTAEFVGRRWNEYLARRDYLLSEIQARRDAWKDKPGVTRVPNGTR